jgi:hypothetical protein
MQSIEEKIRDLIKQVEDERRLGDKRAEQFYDSIKAAPIFSGITEDAGIQAGDFLVYYDLAAGANKKLDIADLDHDLLKGLGDDDHTQYYNSARHTKAVHDALNIDADTLDGVHSNAFYRWVWKTANITLSLTGSASPSWTNYDFTSITSVNCVAVILAWVGNVSANDHQAYIQWRKDGNSNFNAYMAVGGAQYAKSGGQVIVEVDPATEIAEYYYFKHVSASITVYLVGYIEKI